MADISQFIGKYMAAVILAVAALTLFYPASGLWVKLSWVNYLLMIVMFGMGLTLKFSDFKVVFTRPRDILIGCVAQFTIMPLLAYAIGKSFGLGTELLIGMVLVGCCPGGTSSNVITYLSKGDVPLSVGMTAVNTLLAIFLTPALVYLYLRESVDVDTWSMFLAIVEVVVIPLALGFAINYFFGDRIKKVSSVLPVVSVAAIALIVAAVVSNNSNRILDTALIVFAAVILHNMLGYLAGFAVARAVHMPWEKQKALAVEIGMQNSGLATSLAKTSFASYPMAMVPGALFSVWHNISGAILASVFIRYDEYKKKRSPRCGETGPGTDVHNPQGDTAAGRSRRRTTGPSGPSYAAERSGERPRGPDVFSVYGSQTSLLMAKSASASMKSLSSLGGRISRYFLADAIFASAAFLL